MTHSLMVRTSVLHAEDGGSIPPGSIWILSVVAITVGFDPTNGGSIPPESCNPNLKRLGD